MSIYKLMQYSYNYSKTTPSLWSYPIDEATNFNGGIANNHNLKSFDYKTKLLRNTVADGANEILRKCSNCCSIKIFK